MSALALSGWGQPHDALSIITPEAHFFDFAHYADVNRALAAIGALTVQPERVIGWSLGGQLAVRAIALGILKPKQLVLIAAPFQFVKTREHAMGMPTGMFAKFRENYVRNPARTLAKAWDLIHLDDHKSSQVREHLEKQNITTMLEKNWLYWLDALHAFSCRELTMAHFPPTTIIHGTEDKVVDVEQSSAFVKSIPDAKLIRINGCGHAPHFHAPGIVREAIHDE